jgi:hypothetical protein
MKKWLILVFSLFLLFWISCYFFIPEKIIVTKSIAVNANQAGVYRFLTDESNWQKWWPESSSVNDVRNIVFEAGGFQFKKNKPLYNSFEIIIDQNIDTSFLRIFPLAKDSIKIQWNASINTGLNPFNKIGQYFKAKKISRAMETILAGLQRHISNVKNIYGIDIRKELVKIEYLVSTKKAFTHYPRTSDIYEMIHKIKKYINEKQAKEEDYPMLHINANDSTHFEAQVAIPVNKKLPDASIFSSKRMLRNGNILAAEITGGQTTADFAMKQMDIYVFDHQYNYIAIPFFSLVTDRMNVTDTSKWVTRIYYPIM